MAQSLAKNLIHLIFSTKNREPLLSETVRPNLHRYLAGIFKDLESPSLAVNSVADHIHILFNLNKNQSLAHVIMEIIGRIPLAKWLRRVFRQPIGRERSESIYCQSGRTPSIKNI